MEFGIINLIIGIFLVVYDMRNRPKERQRNDLGASGSLISWRYVRLPLGTIYIATGAFFLIEPYNHSLANWVLWSGVILAIAIRLAYFPSFAKWQDWLFRQLEGKDKADDQNDSKEENNDHAAGE